MLNKNLFFDTWELRQYKRFSVESTLASQGVRHFYKKDRLLFHIQDYFS